MSRRSPFVVDLCPEDRRQLEAMVRRGKTELRLAIRAWIVLETADDVDNAKIAEHLGVALNTVIKWRKRFFEEGLDGLAERKRSGRPRSFSPSGGR
jgi:transposase